MKSIFYAKALGVCCLAAIAGVHTPASAADLQVAPVMITLPADKTADAMWLSNPGAAPLQAQVRIYRWTQENGADSLTPATELMASPPMLSIAPGQRQMIRLIRVNGGRATADTEQSFRVVIDEVPDASARTGLQFALRYSVPVFVQGRSATLPSLQWRVGGSGANAWLRVTNGGDVHAQVSNVSFTPTHGKPIALNKGLYGYALARSTRDWPLTEHREALLTGGTLNATINQKPVQFIVPAAKAS